MGKSTNTGFAELNRIDACFLAEEIAKIGGIGVAEPEGDLLHTQRRLTQQRLGFMDQLVVDGLDGGLMRLPLYDGVEVVRMRSKYRCKVLHIERLLFRLAFADRFAYKCLKAFDQRIVGLLDMPAQCIVRRRIPAIQPPPAACAVE